MSAQAGVLYVDGRPVRPEVGHAIEESLRPFGPDRAARHIGPGLAMVHTALHVTPGDRSERQPVLSRSGRYVMTWSGRLDNRDDLGHQLWRRLDTDATDAAYALAAFERWGEDAFERLIGDWSLVLWSQPTGDLILASDYMGNRPLYYSAQDGAIHWSSNLAELVDRLGCRDDFSRDYIVSHLAGLASPAVTPYQAILAVPGGHVLRWTRDGGFASRCFWNLRFDTFRCADGREYERRLRELFSQAVSVRLRSSMPVWAELSGGLDSSSVVCMADRLAAQGAGSPAPVETVSYVTNSSPESDERRFILSVEQQRGRRGHHVVAEACTDIVERRWDWVSPSFPRDTALGLFRFVTTRGGRVLLTGHPGDLVMMNFPADLSGLLEQLAAWNVAGFLRQARLWCRAAKRPIWWLLGELLSRRLAHGAVDRQVRRDLRAHRVAWRDPLAGGCEAFHLTSSAGAIWHEQARARAARAWALPQGRDRQFVTGLLECSERRVLETPAVPGITYTHPFSHLPLVQFMLSLPADVVCGPGRPRLLMKRALADILPQRIARRISKGYAAPLALRTLRRWIPTDLADVDHFYLVQTGYVDPARLRPSLASVKTGACRHPRNLERILAFERWIRERPVAETATVHVAHQGR